MASTIKGITVEIGGNTQPLEKSLKNANKTSRELSSELRMIDKLLKLDPTNTTLLAQKQKVLAESISNTEEKLGKLKTAQEQAQAQLNRGEIGEDQYRALERQVLSVENSLKDLKVQASEVDAALEQAGNGSEQAANGIEDIGDSAKQSQSEMKSFSIGTIAAITAAATAIAATVGKIVSFLTDSVEATKEFRSDLSKLEQNAKAAGTGMDDVSDDLEYFIAITDEADSSVEALSNLLQAGFTKETLTDAVNNLSGAVIKFPDTLKIESLADSLQETLATGAATGQYGELLERLGVNLDDFNAGLQKCTTAAEKQQYAVDILAKHGLADLNAEYKAANADMIAYSTAQTRYTETLSKVGAAMQPVMTALTNMKTMLLEGMIPALETAGRALSEKLASPSVQNAFQKLGEGLAEVATAFANFAVYIIENGEMIVKIIGSIALGFAAWKIASIIQSIGGLKKAFLAIIPAIKNMGKAITAATSATIIGALVTIASIIATVAEAFLGASEETENFKDEMKSLKESAEGMATEFAVSQEALAINGDTMRSLAGEIQRLDAQIRSGSLSAVDLAVAQGQLASKTAQYNAAAGEEVLKINAATGAIEGGTDALVANTEALIKNAKRAAEVEALQKAYEAQTEAQAQQATMLAEIDKYYDQLSDEQKKYIDQMKAEGISVEALSNLWYASPIWGGQVNNEIRGIVEGLEDSVDAESAAAAQTEQLTNVVKENTTAEAERTNAINEQGNAVAALTEQQALQLLRAQENEEALTDTQKQQLESYKQTNAETYQSLAELVEKEKELQERRVEIVTDTNNKIDFNDATSLKKRIENLDANAKAVESYEAGMASIREQAIASGNENMQLYLDTLGDYSEDSMAIISQMVNDYATGGGKMSQELADKYIAALGTKKPQMNQASYDATKEAGNSAGRGLRDNTALPDEAGNKIDDTETALRNAINAAGFETDGMNIAASIARGLSRARSQIYDVVDQIVDTIKAKFSINVTATATGNGAQLRGFATGGVVWNEEIVRVAERGPEAIIPLDRLGGIVNGLLRNQNSTGFGAGSTIYFEPKIELHAQQVTDAEAIRLGRVISREFAKATGGSVGKR